MGKLEQENALIVSGNPSGGGLLDSISSMMPMIMMVMMIGMMALGKCHKKIMITKLTMTVLQ